MMIRRLLPLLLLAAPLALAVEPRTGDAREAVENELGKPIAVRRIAGGTLMAKYPRGVVTYRDGHAVEVKLLTRAEWEQRLADEKAEATAARTRAERATAVHAAQVAEANGARDTLLASEAYRQLSPEGRAGALAALAAKLPDADVGALRADLDLTILRADADRKVQTAEVAFRKTAEEKLTAYDEKLADLRTRLAEADAVNAKLATRLVKAEADVSTLLTRVNTLDEMVRTRTVLPAGAPGASPAAVRLSVGSSDPMRN